MTCPLTGLPVIDPKRVEGLPACLFSETVQKITSRGGSRKRVVAVSPARITLFEPSGIRKNGPEVKRCHKLSDIREILYQKATSSSPAEIGLRINGDCSIRMVFPKQKKGQQVSPSDALMQVLNTVYAKQGLDMPKLTTVNPPTGLAAAMPHKELAKGPEHESPQVLLDEARKERKKGANFPRSSSPPGTRGFGSGSKTPTSAPPGSPGSPASPFSAASPTSPPPDPNQPTFPPAVHHTPPRVVPGEASGGGDESLLEVSLPPEAQYQVGHQSPDLHPSPNRIRVHVGVDQYEEALERAYPESLRDERSPRMEAPSPTEINMPPPDGEHPEWLLKTMTDILEREIMDLEKKNTQLRIQVLKEKELRHRNELQLQEKIAALYRRIEQQQRIMEMYEQRDYLKEKLSKASPRGHSPAPRSASMITPSYTYAGSAYQPPPTYPSPSSPGYSRSTSISPPQVPFPVDTPVYNK